MITFKTETGSVYELDTEGKRMRRLSGTHAPTPHQGADGTWREYTELIPEEAPVVGEAVLIFWNEQSEVEPDTCKKTLTSRVVELA